MLLAYFQTDVPEAGCDEAGRGCLAGPVVAAAVILPTDFHHPLLNDSKQLTEKQRQLLRPVIEREATGFAVASVSNVEIDGLNILKASFTAMHRALDALSVTPQLILVDGNRFIPYQTIPHQCIVGGDGKYAAIAAASVLAKTWRDEHMQELHAKYPYYGWGANKGYGTREHQRALQRHGPTEYHRTSFRLSYEKAAP